MTRPPEAGEGAGEPGEPAGRAAEPHPVLATAASTQAMIRGSIEGSPDEVRVLLPLFDEAGRFVDAEIRYANRAARTSVFGGLPVETLEGERLFERWPALRDALFAPYARVAMTGKPFSSVLVRPDPDGAERHEEVLIFASEGGLVHVGRDVTERALAVRALRESEARYADLVAGLPVGVYSARTFADGRVVFD
jgi:hypothetical protein